MASYANAVITKARAMYGHMLTHEQYAELARKQNLQEISAYLKEKTHFGASMEDVHDSILYRRQLETLLRREELYQYTRLVRYTGVKDGVYSHIIMNREIALILQCLRELVVVQSENFLSDLPTFIQPYIQFDVLALAQVKNISQLLAFLEHTSYGETLKQCAVFLEHNAERKGVVPYAVYEFALRRLYFSTMLAQAKATARGKARRELEELILARAELANLSAVYRMKTFFHMEPARIREQIFPWYGRISEKNFQKLVDAKNGEEFLKLLGQTCYGRFFGEDTQFIEERTELIRHRMNVRLLRFSTDPQVVFTAYMLLSDMETENVIRVIEGVHYGLPPEKIESLLFPII